MPTYGKVKVNTLTYDASGSAVDLAVSGIAPKADPTFTGTITGATAVLTGNLNVDTNTLHVDATNNRVGIGTTSPSVATHIYDGSTDTPLYVDSGSVNGAHMRFLHSGTVKHYLGCGGGISLGDKDDFAIRATDNLFLATGNTSTARLTINSTGNATFAGTLAANGFTGQLKEAVVVTAGKLSDNTDLNIESGNVFLFTTAESTTSTPNLRYNGSTTLDSKMAVGDCLSVTILTSANASAYSAQLTIDGAAVTEYWTGGSAPSSGGSSGWDIHAYTIIKKGSSGTFTSDYAVIANHTKTS